MSESDRMAIAKVALEWSYSGPLPPPAMLRQYDDISPGLADRIVSMAESSLEHGRDMDRKELEAISASQASDHRYRTVGQWMGFAIVPCFLLLIGYLANQGNVWLAGLLATGTLASLAWAFIQGRQERIGAASSSSRNRPSPKPEPKLKRK
jgi:uncharacterized membrane protein